MMGIWEAAGSEGCPTATGAMKPWQGLGKRREGTAPGTDAGGQVQTEIHGLRNKHKNGEGVIFPHDQLTDDQNGELTLARGKSPFLYFLPTRFSLLPSLTSLPLSPTFTTFLSTFLTNSFFMSFHPHLLHELIIE